MGFDFRIGKEGLRFFGSDDASDLYALDVGFAGAPDIIERSRSRPGSRGLPAPKGPAGNENRKIAITIHWHCSSSAAVYYRRMPTAKKAPARKPNAALMKPVQPDEALAKIVGSKPLPRGELTKKLWDYIKKNKLQDAKKKTLINADDALKVVFGGKKQVTMFEMTKHVSGHVKA
jgi:chromatin remodeling complex protein RSC6